MNDAKTITMFGSAVPLPGETAYDDAFAIGAACAAAGWAVCNGGYGGTMEAGAKGAASAGGHTIGITCALFSRRANEWIAEEALTATLEDRLRMLVKRGDGFVVLPGGTGTLLELAYILESMNKGFIGWKPIVLYGSFWEPVLGPLRTEMQRERMERIGQILSVATSPANVVASLRQQGHLRRAE